MAGGPDVAQLPHLYTPYDAAAPTLRRPRARWCTVAAGQGDRRTAVSDFVAAHGNGVAAWAIVRCRARNKDFAAVVDRKTGEVVGYLAVNPW